MDTLVDALYDGMFFALKPSRLADPIRCKFQIACFCILHCGTTQLKMGLNIVHHSSKFIPLVLPTPSPLQFPHQRWHCEKERPMAHSAQFPLYEGPISSKAMFLLELHHFIGLTVPCPSSSSNKVLMHSLPEWWNLHDITFRIHLFRECHFAGSVHS